MFYYDALLCFTDSVISFVYTAVLLTVAILNHLSNCLSFFFSVLCVLWNWSDPKGKFSFYASIMNNKVLLYLQFEAVSELSETI